MFFLLRAMSDVYFAF